MTPVSRFLLRLESPVGWAVLIAFALALGVGIPFLCLGVPETSALHVPTWAVQLIGKYLCYAMLALALDLIWGYAGALSLGHGAFFAIGGYAMGMYLMRQIGTRGVYGNPDLPDFMIFLNWDKLPWYWHGFEHFGFAMLMVVLAPAALAFVFGFLAFRSRITGVYFSIITQAMTYALMLAMFRNDMGFGGNNGLTDYKDILGFDINTPQAKSVLLSMTVLFLVLAFIACRFIVTSRLGRILLAVRGAESRVRFLGHSVTGAKLFGFVASAIIAGIAGALYVPQVGIINPSEFSPGNSIEIAIWVAVGGRGTLFGPIVGALAVNLAKSVFTTIAPEIWLFFLGGLFIAATLFLPNGLLGLAAKLRRAKKGDVP